MDYFIQYDSAAALLLIVVGLLFYSKKFFPSPSNRAFSLLLVNHFIATISDMVSVYTIANAASLPLWINYFVNMIYYITFFSSVVAYLFYLLTLLKLKKSKINKILGVTLFAIEVFLVLFVVTTPFTHYAFVFVDDKYYRGSGMGVMIILAAIMILASMILCAIYRKKISRAQRIATYFFGVMIAAGIIVQVTNPNILIINFIGAVMILIIYQTLQNPIDYVSKELGIYNQHAFTEMLDRRTAKNHKFTVLAFQLEGFQFVDQFMGTDNGNKLLANVAQDCSQNLHGNLYHLEGTQFAMILDADSPYIDENIGWLGWRFLSTFTVCGVAVSLIPRICAVKYPQIAAQKEEIINAIIYSLQAAKAKNSTDVVWATPETIEEQRRYTMVSHILDNAVRGRTFEVYYQPIYSTVSNNFQAAEALIRLRDAELGFISPEEFIPLAEKNGLILEIGDIVFEKVCEFIASGVPEEQGVKYIEVNLSVVQCMQENLHKHLTSIMDRYQIPYNMIDFEITETFANGDTGTLVKNMTELIGLGCTFAMDDYGTGFSNTDYLMEFPFKLIKLDKSFIWSTLSNEKASKILSHTVAMIKSLELLIVAEGVETIEQAELLQRLQCDYLQGYYFSKPLSQDEYVVFLSNSKVLLQKYEEETKQRLTQKTAKKANSHK